MNPDGKVNVAICVLNWEGYPLTSACVEAILTLPELQCEEIHTEIIIIDNGSTDDSVSKLTELIVESEYPHIHLLRSNENCGYAGGNNIGIRFAIETLNPNFIWVLNNDTIPLAGALKNLVDTASSRPTYVMFGSTLLEQDGITIQCAGGCYYNSWLGICRPALAGIHIEQIADSKLMKPLDYICGASIFLRVDFLIRTGGFNQTYFLYYEELDLMKKLREGEKVEWCMESWVVHSGSKSISHVNNMRNHIAEYHSILSQLIFTRKYYSYRLLTLVPVLIMAKTIAYIWNGRWGNFADLYRGVKDFWSGTNMP